jgi:hypothetical protein
VPAAIGDPVQARMWKEGLNMRYVVLVLALLGAISTVTMSVSRTAQACPKDERPFYCDDQDIGGRGGFGG